MSTHDMVIRGGTIVDGSGRPGYVGDVAIKDGRITAVGIVEGEGREEIDAAGLLVTPGFVDIHTHYDGQAIWSDRLNPSSAHGVTTVVAGNCGVGFAPCRKEDHDLLIHVMEGVEDIPGVVMAEGLDWDWESFPQYMDALDKRRRDIDIAVYLPHSPLRVYVMGERGANREPATEGDLSRFRELAAEAVRAGAIGFATSRVNVHKTPDGEFIPSFRAAVEEMEAIANGMADAGGGLIQVVPEVSQDIPYKEALTPMIEVARRTGQPLTFTYGASERETQARPNTLDLMAEAKRDGVSMMAQVYPRPVGLIISLDLSLNPFSMRPSYRRIADLPLAERVEAMRRPEVKAEILADADSLVCHPLASVMAQRPEMIFEMEAVPDYEPDPATSMAALAKAEGRDYLDYIYDRMLEDGGTKMFLVALGNLPNGTLDAVGELMQADDIVVGLGDGGAHYGMICDASFPTTLLGYWGRDRKRGTLPIERIVNQLSAKPARTVGLLDRGLLAPGYKADVNVIDMNRVKLHAPVIRHDLPKGGKRLDQTAEGYRLTIVNGEIIARDGRPTDARPGKLVRGRQETPVAA